MRHPWLLAALFLFLPPARAAVAPANAPGLSASRPNIVLILCDDLGYGDLGCFGSDIIKTPNLDRLAAEGLKLTHCYASAPVCSPSRAGLMTGKTPYRLGIRDWIPPRSGIFLRTNEVTVAKLLKSAGYRTGLSGKWHLNSRVDGSEPTPGDHGFDHWLMTQNNAEPNHQDPVNFIRNGQALGPQKGHATTLVTDEAIRFIADSKTQPFFLYLAYHAPHETIETPEEWTKPYAHFADPHRKFYYGSVSLVDHEVGRLVRELETRGLRENTLVIFTSDNGPETLTRYRTAFRSHGSPGALRGMKLHVTEGGLRVPGIVSWPGRVKAGSVSSDPVNNTDFLPTLAALAGARLPQNSSLDGVSILPLLEGNKLRRPSPIYWEYEKSIGLPWTLALRDGPWKLLADAKLQQFALHNLETDPTEARDLAARHSGRVKRLAALLRERHAQVNTATAASVKP